MKTKLVKTLAFALAVIMMLSMAACGSSNAPAATTAPAATSGSETSGGETPAATEAPVAEGPKKIVIQTLSDPGSYALMAGGGSSVATSIHHIFYEPLFMQYESAELVPVIATGYERVGEGLYEIDIRENVHDAMGNPITIDDVVWCFQATKDAGFRNNVFANVNVIEKVDENTLRLGFIEEYNGEFNNLVNNQGVPIVSRAAFEASGDNFASNPIGTGPYKIKEWVQGSHIIFEKNENYWNAETMEQKQPYDEIEYRFIAETTQIALALETGAVNVALGVSAQDVTKFTNNPNFTVFEAIDSLTRTLLFNCHEDNPFSDVKLRQAVCYAIDAEAIIEAVTEGIGSACKGVIAARDASVFTDYQEEWNDRPYYEYDLDKAKALMAEAGYPDGGLKMRLMSKDTPEYRTTCELIQAYLMEIGIEVEIMCYENALYQTYRYDHTAWDANLCQVGGTDSVVQPWKWYCTPDPNRENRTIYMMEGSEFWPIYQEAAHMSTTSPETVEAAWTWMNEQVPMYGYGFTNKYVIINNNVIDPFVGYNSTYFPYLDGNGK